MFKPSTSTVTFEQVVESDISGWTFQDVEVQGIRDSALQLLPLTGSIQPLDIAWPKIGWDFSDELKTASLTGNWDVSYSNSGILFESGFLHLDTTTGNHIYLKQHGLATTTERKFWSDHVDNTVGWTVQTRVQVPLEPTGEPLSYSHYLHIDDGIHRERIHLHPTGLSFDYNPSLNVYTDLASAPREMRFAGVGNDLYVLLDDGRGFFALNGFTGNSAAKELGFGTTGSPNDHDSYWDYINFYTDGAIADVRPDTLRRYSTVYYATTTPSYQPKRPVVQWSVANFLTSGSLSGGTTRITTQYKSSVTPTWTDLSTATVNVIGWYDILLDNIPTAGDGTDEIRFKIEQKSTTGAEEPPRIETISVVTSFTDGAIGMTPSWGHRDGGNTVALWLTEEALTLNTGDMEWATTHTTSSVLGVTGSASAPAWDWNVFVDQDPQGYLMTGWSYAGTPALTQTTLGYQIGPNIYGYTGQRIVGMSTNDYIYYPAYADGDLSFLLEIESGAVAVTHGSSTHTFYYDDYYTPRVVNLRLTGSNTLQFAPDGAGAVWAVGNFHKFSTTLNSNDVFTGNYQETGDGIAADFYLTPYAYSDGLDLLEANSWRMGLAGGGFPYVRITKGGSEDALTGNIPALIGERTNLAFNYRRFSDHTGLQLLVDGVLAGDKITTIDGPTGTAGLTIEKTIPGVMENVRTFSHSIDARDFSVANGFAPPSFSAEGSAPPDGTNKAIFMFYEDGGTIADDSGKDHHAYLPRVNRFGLYRNRQIAEENALVEWGLGQFKILHSADFIQNLPQSIYVEGVFYAPSDPAILYSKYNLAGTVGWDVTLLTDGKVRVTVKDGSSTVSLISTSVLADGGRRTLYVGVESVGVTIRIDELETSSLAAIGPLTAADQDAQVGPGIYAYFRSFVIRAGTLTTQEYLTWRDWDISKWTPGDTVQVDGTTIPETQVWHQNSFIKYVNMPAHDPARVAVQVTANGTVLPANKPYHYVAGYSRAIPEERIEVCSTKSPFRILNAVPDGSVNLSFVQGPEITVNRNISLIDLSYLELENLATYHGGEFMLTGGNTGSGYVEYTGQVDTEDLLVSSRSVLRRDWEEPTPLFYRYKIGRDRYYVYQPNALTLADSQIIRNGIRVLDKDGKDMPMRDFPWDIEITTLDAYGNALPANVFSVTIFTNKKYLPGVPVQVQYFAADSLHSWRKIPNYLEIINTEPIFIQSDSPLKQDEFRLNFRPDNTFDLQVGVTGA